MSLYKWDIGSLNLLMLREQHFIKFNAHDTHWFATQVICLRCIHLRQITEVWESKVLRVDVTGVWKSDITSTMVNVPVREQQVTNAIKQCVCSKQRHGDLNGKELQWALLLIAGRRHPVHLEREKSGMVGGAKTNLIPESNISQAIDR